MNKIATGSLALLILLGGFAFAQRPHSAVEVEDAVHDAKVDAQLRLTMAKLRARTQLARR